MRFAFLSLLLIGCVASPAPEANGFNVQLFFDAPLSESLVVGSPEIVTVRRIEQHADQSMSTPIVAVSATCDDLACEITSQSNDGVVSLQTIGTRAGTTTLRVRVRSQVDGSEWDDAYPLVFRAAEENFVVAPKPLLTP